MLRRVWAGLLLGTILLTGTIHAQDDSAITPENVDQLHEVDRLGSGDITPTVAWSPDGSRIAAGGYGGFWLYTVADQSFAYYPLDRAYDVTRLLFGPESNRLYLSNGEVITVYDFDAHMIIFTLEGMQPLDVYQDWLAYEYADGVRIINTDTWEQVYDLSYLGRWPRETTSEDDYTQVCSVIYARFLPDGSGLLVKWETMYSASWEGRHNWGYDLWDLTQNPPAVDEANQRYPFLPDYPNLVSILPEGTAYAVSGDTLLSPTANSPLGATLEQNFDMTTIIPFAFQGEFFAFPMEGEPSQTGIWNARSGERLGVIPDRGVAALSPTGDRIVIDTIVYDVASGDEIAYLQNNSYRILPGTDRILWLKFDNTLHLLDTADFSDIATLDLPRSEMYASQYPSNS